MALSRTGPVRRWLLRGALALGVAATVAASATAVTLAASGVFDYRAGAWTVALRPLPGVTVQANVSGLLRLATSPLGLRLLDGRVRTTQLGTLAFQRDGAALIIRCAPCRLHDARVASRRIALPPTELRVSRRPGVESNNVLDVELRNAHLAASAAATLSPEAVRLDWQLPATPLAAVVRTLADAIPEARNAQVGGSVQASGRIALPLGRDRRPVLRLHLDRLQVEGLGTEALRHGRFALNCPLPDGTPRQFLTGEGERTWASLDALGPLMAQAAIAAEDQRFEEYAGYDLTELARALAPDGDDRPRGASTITQQLARTLYTGHERTLARKLRELLYAVEMERTLGKPRILELYLNTVDWGPGLCGARAASRAYFGKRVPQLSPLEAAWLAGILRAPHAAHREQWATQTPRLERARWVLMQMRSLPRSEREKWSQRGIEFAPAGARGGVTVPAVAGVR